MKKLLVPEGLTPGQKPFLEAFLEANPSSEKTLHELIHFSESRKRAGFILETDKFKIHIWKSEEISKPLCELIIDLVEKPVGHAVYLEISETYSNGFEVLLAEDETRNWFAVKKFGGRIAYSRKLSIPLEVVKDSFRKKPAAPQT